MHGVAVETCRGEGAQTRGRHASSRPRFNVVAASLGIGARDESYIARRHRKGPSRLHSRRLGFRSEAASLRTFAAFLDEPRPIGTAHQSTRLPLSMPRKRLRPIRCGKEPRAQSPSPRSPAKRFFMTRLDGRRSSTPSVLLHRGTRAISF